MEDDENCGRCGGILRPGMEINSASYVCVGCGHMVYTSGDSVLREPSGEDLDLVEVRIMFAGEIPTADELVRLKKLVPGLRRATVGSVARRLIYPGMWPLGIIHRYETDFWLQRAAAAGLEAVVLPPTPRPPRRRWVRYGIPAICSVPVLSLYYYLEQRYRYPGDDPAFGDALLSGEAGTLFGFVVYHVADRARREYFLPPRSLFLTAAGFTLVLAGLGGLDRPAKIHQYFLELFLITLPFGIPLWLTTRFLARKAQ